MPSKGRFSPGQVAEIRKRHALGERQVDLGKEFGVSQSAISAIVRGKSYPVFYAHETAQLDGGEADLETEGSTEG